MTHKSRIRSALAALSLFFCLTAQTPATPGPADDDRSASAEETPAGGAGRALTSTDVSAWLDGLMPYALKAGRIPGAVVVVVDDGAIIAEKGYGFADLANRQPVDPRRTLFRIGSISKLFTWTAVMQQVEAGRLDLDQDVNAYLDFRIPPYEGKPLTLRDIMTHTPGFEESLRYLFTTDPAALLPLDEYAKRALPHQVYAPGTTPAYSNYATALAATLSSAFPASPTTLTSRTIFWTPWG